MAWQSDILSLQNKPRQMRSNYAYQKAGMGNKTINNRKFMERVFRNKAGIRDSTGKAAMTSAGAAILITLVASRIRGLDMRLAGMIAAFYVLMLIGYALIYRKLGKVEYGTDNVLSTVTRLRRFKRNYMIANTVLWVLVIVLMCFLFPEIHNTFRIPERGIAAIAFMCVAVLAGICIQYFMDRKVLMACDEIIDQLKDRS